ncbi:MAG: S9 family peptidase, partial [Chloroflexi bacterium]
EMFYICHSFVYPPTVFRYDFAERTNTLIAQPRLAVDFERYEIRQEFAISKDGTRVPLSIVQRKGTARDGQNPTLLYGYGGFNVSQTPNFLVSRLLWLELGGVFAMANLRGGGEYGEAWHEAGTLHNKQNVFDDFIACAEHLIRERVTTPPNLAIQGGSNGGLLVAACLTQRPELFGAVHVAVGVLDMLRYHRFTVGAAWVTDYGSADDPAQFKTLLAYSPLHNIRPGTCYPPTLITTSDHDDRVVPAHSFKFAAALQLAQSCENPVLIRIQTKAGHGVGKPTSIQIEEAADVWAFLAAALRMTTLPAG